MLKQDNSDCPAGDANCIFSDGKNLATDPTWQTGVEQYTCTYDKAIDLTPYYDHPYIRDNLCVVKCAADPTATGCFNFISEQKQNEHWGPLGYVKGFNDVAGTGTFHVGLNCRYELGTDGKWTQNIPPVVNARGDYFCGSPYKDAGLPGLERINDLLCGEMEDVAAMCHYVDECAMFTVLGDQLQDPKYKKSQDTGGVLRVGAITLNYYGYNGDHPVGVMGRLYFAGCDKSNGWGIQGSIGASAFGYDTGPSEDQRVAYTEAYDEVDQGVVSYFVDKMIDASESSASCPLGKGAELFFGDYSDIRGLYQYETDGSYTHIDNGHKISKEPLSGSDECGWKIEEVVTAASATPGAGPGVASCADDNLALNFLLKQCNDPKTCQTSDPDYEDNLCAMLQSVWSAVGTAYCSDPIFAGVCRATCAARIGAGNCGEDIDTLSEAQQVAFVASGGDGATRNWDVDYTCSTCDTVADLALCPTTCAGVVLGRRLSKDDVKVQPNLERRLSAIHRQSKAEPSTRRLQTTSTVVYKSCAACGDTCTATLPSGGWRNFQSYFDCLDASVQISCPTVNTYAVVGGTYCKNGNINTKMNPNPEIADNNCIYKCGSRTSDINPDTGDWDWCSGNHWPYLTPTPGDDYDDLALCLPQEKCEELCDATESCISIDMHKRLPRCYLNMACPETAAESQPVCGRDNCLVQSLRTTLTGVSAADETAGLQNSPNFYFSYPTDCTGEPLCTNLKGCQCAVQNALGDVAYQWKLLEKLAPLLEPSLVETEPSTAGATYYSTKYSTSYPAGQFTTDSFRHKFIRHTYANCIADADKHADLSWTDLTAKTAAEGNNNFLSTTTITIDYTNKKGGYAYEQTCQGLCMQDDECAGFQYTPLIIAGTFGHDQNAIPTGVYGERLAEDEYVLNSEGICQFFKYTDSIFDDEGVLQCENKTVIKHDRIDIGVNLNVTRTTFFVQKIPAPLCTATVSNLPPDAAAFNGEYVKSGGDLESQLSPIQWDKIDNTASLVFESSSCDSWELYENLGETTVDLQVCVDFAEAAAAYFALSPTTSQLNGAMAFGEVPEFPCQTGYEQGYCDNYVFAGLCPHSCQPLAEYTADLGPRTGYMRKHGYTTWTETPPRPTYQTQVLKMYEHADRFQALFADDSCTDDDPGYCNTNCTTGPYGKITDCSDCLGATSVFCNAAGTNYLKSASDCGQDNNVAMFFYVAESEYYEEVNSLLPASTVTPGSTIADGAGAGEPYTYLMENMHTACEKVIQQAFYDVVNYPCAPNPKLNYLIVQALCPITCQGTDPTKPPSPAPLDETDTGGASVRQLGTTVSWSGKMTGLGNLVATYTHTYPLGPVDLTDPLKKKLLYKTVSGVLGGLGGCASTATSTSPLDTPAKMAAAYDLLEGSCFYRREFSQVEPSDLIVQQVCRGFSNCPEYQMCVMSPSRFHDELYVWRYSIGLHRHTHLMQLDGPAKDQLFSTNHYIPKVLTTVDRVEAIMTSGTYSYFPSIYRPEPGAMRLSIVDDPALTDPGTYLVLMLFKPDEYDLTSEAYGEGYREGGTGYTVPYTIAGNYVDNWLTDVIRIERFNADTTSMETGTFTVDLLIPDFDFDTLTGLNKQAIEVFQFPPVAGAPPTAMIGKPGVSLEPTPDRKMLRLTVPTVYGDFVLIQDKNECLTDPCDPVVGICQNTYPGFTCDCESTHECVGADCLTCRMKTESLPDYYLVLTHTSRLDYGWRVKQVQFFEKQDCTGAAITSGISAPASLTDHGLGTATDYPGTYAPSNLDGAPGEWWSACVTCNPDKIFDETHGGPAQLEWVVSGNVAVGCIKVDQGSVSDLYGGHASRGLKVERGPVSRVSPPCGGAGKRCQSTMTVTATCGEGGTDTCASTGIPLGCGMDKTLLWGEVLEPPGTEQFGFFGSYGQAGGVAGTLSVPSSCHCHDLCISYVGSACRSYKFFDDGSVKHCMLQTSEFFTYKDGIVGAPPGSAVTSIDFYTSGTPMDRTAVAMVGKPRVLGAAKPWVESFSFADGVISVNGYGFPTKNTVTKADRGRYQRVKVVARGEPCSSAVPSAVSGIGCVNTLLKSYAEPHQNTSYAGKQEAYRTNEQTVYTVCSTRPTSWTSEVVTWDGIAITAGSMEKSYDVCYCDGKECSRPESWIRVPPLTTSDGTIGASDYNFEASSTVDRGGSVEVKVTGPAFGMHAPVSWEIKAVPSHFACTVSTPYTDGTSQVLSTSEAKFTLSFADDISAVGEYTVCFSIGDGEPFSPLAGTLSVVPLKTDRTHAPLGAVYREQRWSALTGGSKRTLSLKGTKLPSVSDSKVALSYGSTCAWPDYSFEGKVERQPTTDSTAPNVVWSMTVPANGETVSSATAIKVVFNELLSEPKDCLGGYTLKPVTGGPTYTVINSAESYFIACDSKNKTIIDNFLLLNFDAPADGMYALFFDSYTIADLDGNSMFLSGSLDEATGAAVWIFTVGTDSTAPVMLTSEPKFGLLTGTGVISLTFSEPVVPVSTGYADLVDCGDDFVCDSDDKMIAKYEFSDPNLGLANTTASGSAVFKINLMSIVDVYNYKRYRLTFAANSFRDIMPGPPMENFAPTTVLEFVKDSSGSFDMMNVLGPSASGADGLTYDLELTAPPGTYSLCYCDSQMDNTLFDAGDSKTTAKPTFGQKASPSTTWTDIPVETRLLSAHICSTKCAAGCVGDDCFCSGYEEGEGDLTNVYCISPSLCRSVCDELGPACAGFGTKGEDSCVLYQSGFTLAPAGAWTSYTKETGTACTDPYEFSTLVGKVTVTARADVYVEYVVEPNVVTTLEVAGTNMMSMRGGVPLALDRIMVVDCDGMCGYSAASTSVTIEASGWNDLEPLQWGIDKPHEDAQNTVSSTWSPKSWAAHDGAMGEYTTVRNQFCEENLQISSLADIPMEGFDRSPTIHLCYNKCILQDCVGDDCFCGGAYTGYDTESSNALCADEALCKHLCDSYESCKSIDMAKDKTRCFLNSDTCDASDSEDPVPDMNYDLLIKVIDQNGNRRLESEKPVEAIKERSLLPAMDSGYSHTKLLIFPNVKFTSGGTFKVCFCDSTLRGEAGCLLPEHYGVEVGEVQASGISCLLTNSLFNRKTCVPMGSAGGLRCYSGTPPDTEPPLYPDVQPDEPVPGASGPGEPVASTYCRLHPELCR
jgi:hypothetical protein